MAAPPLFLADGSLDWTAGVDSLAPTTVQSSANPGGVKRNQVCWANNCSFRDGGISPRGGWNYLGTFHNPAGLFQGKFLYQPVDDSAPYFLIAVSGHIYQVFPDNPGGAVELSTKFSGMVLSATEQQYFFVQGEQFVVIQDGGLVNLPLFWDGATLRRSNGIVPFKTQPSSYASIGTGFFSIPANGNSVTINLSAAYPGIIGDILDLITPASFAGNTFTGGGASLALPPSDVGTFQVTGISGNTVTLRTQVTTTPGSRITPGNLTFLLKTSPLPVSEMPAAGPMDYFMGRIWYAQGTHFTAGDIVGGPSGTLPYLQRDSILKITENPLAIGGDGFAIPSSAGNIRSLKHTANLDSAFGEGQFLIGTRKAIYKLQVPVSRTDWIASDNTNQPRLTVAQLNNGTVGQLSVVNVNGDIYYQSLEPSIRSLIQATRFFEQPGNRSVSSNEQRVLQFSDRSLLRFVSGVAFDNRLLMTALPTQTAQGVACKGIIPLDFVPISNFGEGAEPAWQGIYEGLDFFQLATGEFGGLERCFATVRLQDGSFSIWELSTVARTDKNPTGEVRIDWSMEFPAFTHGQEFLLKQLVSGELWCDRISGEVLFKLEYRPDGSSCWILWHEWKVCAARTSAEDCANPISYPLVPYGDGYKQTMTLPKPPIDCEVFSSRPSDVAYQQQCRLTVKGYARIRGFILHASKVERPMYADKVC